MLQAFKQEYEALVEEEKEYRNNLKAKVSIFFPFKPFDNALLFPTEGPSERPFQYHGCL